MSTELLTYFLPHINPLLPPLFTHILVILHYFLHSFHFLFADSQTYSYLCIRFEQTNHITLYN